VVSPALRPALPQAPPAPPRPTSLADREVVRSLERIDADLAEARAEVERLKERLSVETAPE
jgi:hypothetical protein